MTFRLPSPRRPVDGTRPGPTDPDLSEDHYPVGEAVTVEVVGSRSTARRLAGSVPAGWRVVPTAIPSHHPCVDVVVLVRPDRAHVVDVLARHRGVQVAVVLDGAAPATEIAALLDAGVTACVREGPAQLVVGHLVACRRRRADRAPG